MPDATMRPRRRIVVSTVTALVAAGSLVAMTPATPASADTTPPCSTRSVDDGSAYTVPAGVPKVRIVAYGAAGEAGLSALTPPRRAAGNGAKVVADVAVTAGDVLQPMRIDGGAKGGGGQHYNGQVPSGLKWGAYGTHGGAARGVVRVQSGCRQILVVAGGGGGNGSASLASENATDPDGWGRGLSSTGGDAGLPTPGGEGQAGHDNRNDQEDGAGGGGASLTSGGGGGAGGHDSFSACADGFGGAPGGFESAGAGANGPDQGECDPRDGAGGGGGGYYGGGGGGSHQSSGSGSGAGGGGSSHVIAGASNVAYEASTSETPPGPAIVPIYTPAGAPTAVTAVRHNARADVSFAAPSAPYEIASYTVTSSPGGKTASVPAGTGTLTGTVTGLSNGTPYRFTVTAVPAEGVLLDGSPAVSPQSNAVTPVPEIPAAVRNFQATPGDGIVDLTWDAPADDGGAAIIDYTVSWPSGAGGREQTSTTTSMQITLGLTNGQPKTFTIIPRNSVGNGPSTTVTTTPRANALPVKQPAPTGTPGNGFVDVQFTPAEPGYDQFVVTTTPAPLCGQESVAYTADYGYGHPVALRVSCLQNDTEYRFSVAARNDRGVGPTSDLSDPVVPTFTKPTYVDATVSRGMNALDVNLGGVSDGGSPVTSISVYAVKFGVGVATPVVTVPLETPGGLPDHLTIPDLQAGAFYEVYASATNARGTMAYQSVGYGRPYGVPDEPTDVTVSVPNDADGKKVDISFHTTQRAECGTYEITASPGDLTKTGDIGNGGDECGDAQLNNVQFGGLTNGVAYTFTVRVIDAVAGPSAASEPSDPINPYATKRPDAVTGLSAVAAGSGKVKVTFDPSPDDWKYPVSDYTVVWSGGSRQVFPNDVADGLLLTGLQNGQQYQFSVTARNDVGSSDAAFSGPVTPHALAEPTNLAVSEGNRQARLSFDTVENNGGGDLEYVVAIKTLNDQTEVVTDTSPVLLIDLDDDVNYDVTVRARNDDGESAESDSIGLQTQRSLPPMPTNVIATAGLGQATISWDRPELDEQDRIDIVGYTVTAHPGDQQVEVDADEVDTDGDDPNRLSTTMTGLTNGTAYTFTVHASADSCPPSGCGGLESDPSNEVTPQRLTQLPIVLSPDGGTYGQQVAVDTSDGSGTGSLGDITATGDACRLDGSTLTLLHATTADRTCTLSVTKAGDETYQPSTAEQVVTIGRKPLTVTGQDQHVVYGEPFPTLVDVDGLITGDDESDLGGTLAFGGSAVTDPGAGERTLTPAGLTSGDYDITFVDGTVTFDQRPVTLQLQPADKVYGADNPDLHATADDLVDGDELDYSLSTTATTGSRPGQPYPIVADLGDNPDYDVTVRPAFLVVGPAPLTITADDVSAPYGEQPDFSVTPGGLVGDDSLDDLSGTLTFDTVEPGDPHPDGTFTIVPSGLASPYYDIAWVNGTLTRTARASHITWADPDPIGYGTELSGAQLGAVVDAPGTLTYDPAPGTVLHAGPHTLNVTFVPDDPGVVQPASTTVDLTVTRAPLTITARDATKVYGADNPRFEVDYDGFVDHEGPGALDGELGFDTDADANSPVDEYDVTPEGLASDDYAIAFAEGTLDVTRAPLTVTTRAASRAYGEENPAFEVDYAGFVGDEGPGDLDGDLEFETDADADSPVDEYDVTPSGLSSPNYALTFDPGTLTVTKAGSGLAWGDPDDLGYGTALSEDQLDATAGVPGTFTYDPAPGTVLHAGPHTLRVTFVPDDEDTHESATTTVQLEVTRAPLTVTARDATKVYGESNPAFEVDYDGFVGDEGLGDLDGDLEFDTDADESSPVDEYDVTPSGLASDDYAITFAAGTLRVTKATPTVAWDDPDEVGYGTALSGTQLDATASVDGTFTYTPAAGTVLTAGPHELSVEFVPDDSANYRSVSATAEIQVRKATPTITWDDPDAIRYGTSLSDDQLDATASVDGTLTYTPAAGTILHPGPHELSVEFVPDDTDNYRSTSTTADLTVTKAPLTVTTRDTTKIYGESNPDFEVDYDGFVNHEGRDALDGDLSFDTDADADSPVDEYDVTPGGLASDDYTITFEPGTLRVTKATPTVTWGDPDDVGYGTVLSVTQLDAEADVPGTLTYTPALGTVLHAGAHDLTVSFAPDDARDYEPATSTVRLTVTPTPLTVTADDASRAYRADDPPLTVSYDGFRNGDGDDALDGTLAVTTPAGRVSPAGTYPITPSGLSSDDYDVDFRPGTLTVTAIASAVAWADAAPIEYGEALSAAQLDATAGAPGTFTYTPALGTVLRAGSHELSVRFVPTDPSILPSTGTVRLTVTKAPLTVTVKDVGRAYGRVNPAFAATYAGLRNGDGVAALGGAPAYTTGAGTTSGVGRYPVSISGLTSPDYDITYVDGTLTVTKARVLVTAETTVLSRSTRPRRIRFRASVVNAATARPVAGVTLRFAIARTNGGSVTCTGTTNARGVGQCRTRRVQSASFETRRYVVRSAATTDLTADRSTGPVARRGEISAPDLPLWWTSWL